MATVMEAMTFVDDKGEAPSFMENQEDIFGEDDSDDSDDDSEESNTTSSVNSVTSHEEPLTTENAPVRAAQAKQERVVQKDSDHDDESDSVEDTRTVGHFHSRSKSKKKNPRSGHVSNKREESDYAKLDAFS